MEIPPNTDSRSSAITKSIGAALILGIIAALALQSAFARTKVQHNTTGESTSDIRNVTIERVDRDKSIILMSMRTYLDVWNGGRVYDPQEHKWGVRFINNTTIQLRRDTGASQSFDLAWYVVESDAFQVEYIETHFNTSELGPKTVNLTGLTPYGKPVDFKPDKSFAVTTVSNCTDNTALAQNAYYFYTKLLYNETTNETTDQL
ncbi:MAG: hypothetical protein MJA29_06920, partial [Candidatus Omnitrophica bacterium]|nr:hypothetical protein [Candidatus Omnitrophota bacterium]